MEVVRTHLELTAREKLRPSRAPSMDARITRRDHITPAEYIELYSRVGGPWHWRDRLAWSESDLAQYLGNPDIRVYTLDVGGQNAGYFELKQHADGTAEVMYFGLDQRFIGRGLGGWMLSRAVEEAFTVGAQRVILNTCTLDAPHALPNYLARGFVITREERYTVTLDSAGTAATGTAAP